VAYRYPYFIALKKTENMIQSELYHHIWSSKKEFVRSHRLKPSDDVTLFCIISGEKENIISVLEDHILESLSTIEWSHESIGADFWFVSESFNHFIQNIDESDRVGFDVLLAVLIDSTLTFAHTGETGIILIEQNGDITNLSNAEAGRYEFQAISSGEILEWSSIYLSNIQIDTRLSDDVLKDLSGLNIVEWKNIIHDILKEDADKSIHIWYILHEKKKILPRYSTGKKQIDILRDKSQEIIGSLNIDRHTRKIRDLIDSFFTHKRNEVKYILLAGWVVLLFLLVYTLFWAFSWVINSPERDNKNQLLRAQELVEESQKLVNNPWSFNQLIEEAEGILFGLREKRLYMWDTQSLLWKIEAMKKEVNDIQTIDISKLNPIMKLEAVNISPVWVFEHNKKLTLIGKEWAITGYARGEPIPSIRPYPTWERAKSFGYNEDGTYFIITEQNKILGIRWNEIGYYTSNGKNDWPDSPIIGTFNGNIYLLWEERESVIRYRPGINWFSSASTLIPKVWEKILDIWIDGWIYAILQSGKVVRYIGGTSNAQKNLNINKIPGQYTIWKDENTQIFAKQNLSYVYVLSGKNIWIFSPDSRRFQDVTAWNYIAQLELQSNTDQVRHISIPRDGIIYISTDKNIYELPFEIADWKIILR